MSIRNWIQNIKSAVVKGAEGARTKPESDKATVMLQRFLDERVRLSSRRYHAENLTIEFLLEYLPSSSPFRPKPGEWLRNWDNRPKIPSEIRAVRDLAYSAMSEKLGALQKQETERVVAEGNRKAMEILARHSVKIDKFLEIAYRKVAAPDEYGDENPGALDDEIRRLVKKVGETEAELQHGLWLDRGKGPLSELFLGPVAGPIVRELRLRFDGYYRTRKAMPTSSAVEGMSGVEFELHVAELLRSVGIKDVSTTPVTGDQGGDLLFTWEGTKYVVQAKRYTGSVGNKAVQEAHAAKGFYGCDRAWVVTSSRYTSSAKALAKELQIDLADGETLRDFPAFTKKALAARA